jgi:hypothetical protein
MERSRDVVDAVLADLSKIPRLVRVHGPRVTNV